MLKWTFMLSALATVLIFNSCEDEVDPVTKDPILLDCNFARNGDTTLTNDPDRAVDYIIDCQAVVGAKLTIEPGVVIHFKTDAGLEVIDAGTLVAKGTASERIVLEGEDGVAGQWSGVIVFSNDVLNTMEYLDIRHAGGAAFNSNDDRGNIIVYADGRLKVDNVLSEMSETWGLNAPYQSFVLNVTNSTFTGNALEPVQVRAIYVHGLDASNDFTGNGNDVILVPTRTIQESVTWQNLNVPYFVTNGPDAKQTISGGSLTIEEGATLIFDADCGLQVTDGFINAEGTATAPITFTGLTKQPGAWKGLLFRTNNLQNVLDYAVIEYTGSGSFNSNGDEGAIIVWADAYLSLSNSTLSNSSAGCAINAPYNGENVVQSNNTITGFANNYCD